MIINIGINLKEYTCIFVFNSIMQNHTTRANAIEIEQKFYLEIQKTICRVMNFIFMKGLLLEKKSVDV